MPEIGQSSRTAEEEDVFIDIPVDTEQLRAPEPEMEIESDPEEDHVMDSDEEDVAVSGSEPVRGGVMRYESEEEHSPVYHPIYHPFGEAEEEVEEEGVHPYAPQQPVGFPDGMGSTAEDIIEGLTTRQEELEGRVHQLEEENQTHQESEDHYRDAAYQLQQELDTTRAQLQRMEHNAQQLGPLLHQLMAQDAERQTRMVRAEQEAEGLKIQRDTLREMLEEEVTDRLRVDEQLRLERERTADLEAEGRARRRRIDRMSYAFTTGFGRWMDRVHYFPPEEGQTLHTMSRARMISMGFQEYDEAVQRGMLH